MLQLTRIAFLSILVASALIALLPVPRRYFALAVSHSIPIDEKALGPAAEGASVSNLRWTLDHVPLFTLVDWSFINQHPKPSQRHVRLTLVALPAAGTKALDEARRLVAESPKDPVAYVALIEALAKRFDAAAIEELRKTAEDGKRLEPQNAFFDLALAGTAATSGNLEEAAKTVIEASRKQYNPHEWELAQAIMQTAQDAGAKPAKAALSARTLLAALPHHALFRQLAVKLVQAKNPPNKLDVHMALVTLGGSIRKREASAQGVYNGTVIQETAWVLDGKTLETALRESGRLKEADLVRREIETAAKQRGFISIYNSTQPGWLEPHLKASLLWYWLAVIISALGICFAVGLLASIASSFLPSNGRPTQALNLTVTVTSTLPVDALTIFAVITVSRVWQSLPSLASAPVTPELYIRWSYGVPILMVAAAAITSIAANRQAGHPGFGRIFLRTLSWAWPWILAQLLVGVLIVSILIYIQENSAANLIESVLKNGELGLLEQTIQRALPK